MICILYKYYRNNILFQVSSNANKHNIRSLAPLVREVFLSMLKHYSIIQNTIWKWRQSRLLETTFQLPIILIFFCIFLPFKFSSCSVKETWSSLAVSEEDVQKSFAGSAFHFWKCIILIVAEQLGLLPIFFQPFHDCMCPVTIALPLSYSKWICTKLWHFSQLFIPLCQISSTRLLQAFEFLQKSQESYAYMDNDYFTKTFCLSQSFSIFKPWGSGQACAICAI